MTQRRIQVVSQYKAFAGWRGLFVLSLLTFHTFVSVAAAQQAAPTAPQPAVPSVENGRVGGSPNNASSRDAYGAWGQLLLGWLVKRLGGGKSLHNAGVLKLVARANLSPKHQMFLVRMGNRLVLVGAGPQGLTTLSEITDAEEATKLLQAAGQKTEGGRA